MSRIARWFVVIALAGSAAYAEGDASQGQTLAYTCLGCHGIAGYRNAYPSYRVPKLGGQKPEYLQASLEHYRAGTRPHLTMQAQGTDLSDQDIEDLAAFFAGAELTRDTVSNADIEALDAAKTCLACHGAAAEGVVPTPPTLSGQHSSYLQHALEQYRSGARGGTVMSAFAGSLTDADIENIALFYSRRNGLRTPDRDE